jgi:hypothetical protein
MKIDPRRLAAFQIQLDALIHEAKEAEDPEIEAALEKARAALSKTSGLLRQRGLFLQIPHGYKTPPELEIQYLQLPHGYKAPPGLKGRTNPRAKKEE